MTPVSNPGLTGVQAHEVPEIWPFVEDMFADSMHRFDPDWTLEDVVFGLGEGTLQLWLVTSPERAIEAAFITRVAGGKCRIGALVGEDCDRWVPLVLEALEDWALSIGCHKISWHGRKGWERKVKIPGYRTTCVTMEKDLM